MKRPSDPESPQQLHKISRRDSSSDQMLIDTPKPEDITFHEVDALTARLVECKHINATRDNARSLLRQHPPLRNLIKEYLRTGDNGPVLASKYLKEQSPAQTVGHDALNNPRLIATPSAWNIKYQGETVDLFVETINEINKTRRRIDYDNFIPIVQSSGTGKSRTIDEVAKTVFTLPFNLQSAGGFPPPDDAIRNLLVMPRADMEQDALQIHYYSLFRQIFLLVAEEIRSLSTQSPADLAMAWYNKLRQINYRVELYDRACKKFHNSADTKHDTLEIASEKSTDALNNLLDIIAEKSGVVRTDKSVDTFANKSTDEPLQDRPVRLMMYFDESHGLLSQSTKGGPGDSVRSAYEVLCKILCKFSRFDLFVVYLSTNSNLSKIHGTDNLQTPFIELPFDNSAEYIVREGEIKLSDVSTPKHMVKFGRPLFWTRWESGSGRERWQIFDFACTKIFWSMNDKPDDWSIAARDGRLAAASMRLLLELDCRRGEAKMIESRLIEGHMRMAFSISKHGERLRSGTPSEPVLAEAAARIMNDPKSGGTLAIVSRVLDNGLISKGGRGELVGRLLLTLAHDRCVEFQEQVIGTPYASAPIRLSSFLEALVGEANMANISNARPNNVPDGIPFSEAFKDARINFTHFVKGDDDSILMDKMAWLGLARFMAFQCANGALMYIPVLLRDVALSRWVVTGIFVQIKNRLKKQAMYLDAEKIKFFSPCKDDAANSRPYITIVMEFDVQPPHSGMGVTPNPGHATESTKLKNLGQPLTPPNVAQVPPDEQPNEEMKWRGRPKSMHPRYAISIVGCSPAAYDVIDKCDISTYTRLLASQGILNEHPRQDESSIGAVLRMKPYWSKAANSHHWANVREGHELDEDTETIARQDGVFVSNWDDFSDGDEWEE